MTHDNPYDQAAADNAAEDRRQALAEGAEEAENERRQLMKLMNDPLHILPDCAGDDGYDLSD